MILPDRPADPRAVARHYDELERVYRELWGEHLHHGLFLGRRDAPQEAAARLVRLVAEVAGIVEGETVLDVGCGYGATARMLAHDHGARVTGINLSRAQLDWALERARGTDRIVFEHLDWMDNGLPDASFDVVLAIESLAHMPDKLRFFQEAHRTLRPGGRIVVCAWLAGARSGAVGRKLLLEPICREGVLSGLGTLEEYQELATRAGLDVIKTKDLTRQVRRTWSVAARRLVSAVLRRAEYRRLLRNRQLVSRRFAVTVFRIRMAYAVGAMRYGLLAAKKA